MEVLKFKNTYWNYYVQLENDFFSYSPYCEIDQCNDFAFSVKYLQLLLSVCGEIDSICKSFCKALDDNFKPNRTGINDYIPILRENYQTFETERVIILNYEYREVQPWESITRGASPNWWKDYNEIKHHRDEKRKGKENYKYATQKNTVEALCALYILIEYWAAKNFVVSEDDAFAQSRKDPNNHIMYRLKSSRLNMPNWTFYESFMGQEPWFTPKKFYQYLEGESV